MSGARAIILEHGNSGMGRVAPGTHLAVRELTEEELPAFAEQWPILHEAGHRWVVVLADEPDRVLFDWFTPRTGVDRDETSRVADRYARARGAEVVEL